MKDERPSSFLASFIVHRSSFIVLLLLALVGAFACLHAHQRALDPIIDTGRDLYIAERIAGGATLYRDLAYNYPPVAPYLLAAFVSLFGASLGAFAAFGILVGAATLATLYLLVRETAGSLAAAAAGLLFVSLNLAGASTWGANYIFPYGYAATVGMLFSLLSFITLLRARTMHGQLLAAAFALLACGSKLEYAISMAAVFAVAAAMKRSRSLVLLSIPVIVAAGAVILLGRTVVGGESASAFYATVAGTDDLWQSFALAAAGALGIALFAFVLRHVYRRGVVPLMVALGLAILTWLLASDIFFRAWAILQIAVLLWAIRKRNSELILIAIFGIASTVRIAMNVTPGWYGFALILPVYVVIARVLFRELPDAGIYSRRAAWLWLPLIGLLATWGLVQQRERYALKSYPIRTMRGVLYDVNPDRARAIEEFLAAARVARPASLVVFPEGVSLNYFAGVPTPLRRYIFTPPETQPAQVEREVLEGLKSHPPAAIAIVSRDLHEFGSRGFGVDYNQPILAWIAAEYRPAREWRTPRFEMLLFARR